MPGIEGGKREAKQDYKQMSLQWLADKIREMLSYYLNDDLRRECLKVNIYRAAEIIKDYENEIGCLLSAFWESEESVGTKARVQQEKFGKLLEVYGKSHSPRTIVYDMMLSGK